jgi:hypothetical protein
MIKFEISWILTKQLHLSHELPNVTLGNLGCMSTVTEHFNTLQTGNADLSFYNTTVQDG